MASGKSPQVIDIGKLSLEQLQSLRNQLDQELQFFTDSLQQLKIVQVKFGDSGECLEKLSPETEGHELLVPLTSCMYVPGKVADSKTVLIDVGTGYYIEKDLKGAKNYFDRKVKFLTEQMEKIQKIATEKNKLRDVVTDMLEEKVNQQLAHLKQQQPEKVKA